MNKEEEKYNNLKRETEVIAKIWNLLMQGKFSGAAAQDLAIAQMYVQGLHKHLQAEVDKLAPLELPIQVKQPEGTTTPDSAVKSNPSPIPNVSTVASEPVRTELKQEASSNV